jgi:hypothetical protein
MGAAPRTSIPRISTYGRQFEDLAASRPWDVETGSGLPDSLPECPEENLASGGFEKIDPPRWLREAVRRGEGPEEVIRLLRQRALSGDDLHAVKAVLNSIGRMPGGGRLVREAVTPDLILKLARRA